MIVKTGRFGQLTVVDGERIHIPHGIFGFPDDKNFILVDPGDDTLILWLQSLDHPEIAFPVLEPKIFKPDYIVRLSGAELRELKLENINQSAVFSILTIPSDISQMTANLKAPLVINLNDQLARQVVLQENEYNLKHSMFKELRTHLMTIDSQKRITEHRASIVCPIAIKSLPPSTGVKSLNM